MLNIDTSISLMFKSRYTINRCLSFRYAATARYQLYDCYTASLRLLKYLTKILCMFVMLRHCCQASYSTEIKVIIRIPQEAKAGALKGFGVSWYPMYYLPCQSTLSLDVTFGNVFLYIKIKVTQTCLDTPYR